MKKRNILAFIGIICMAIAGISQAMPIKLYKFLTQSGVDAYKLAEKNGWHVYFISKNILLVDRDVSREFPKQYSVSCILLYEGDTKNLKWVSYKRNAADKPIIGKAIFEANGIYLVEEKNVYDLLFSKVNIKTLIVREFEEQTIKPSESEILIDPELAKDAFIASLADQIDTAMVRQDLEDLQAFTTRYVRASNHAEVAEWLRQKFTDMGISNVQVDTFTFTPWWSSEEIVGYNVVATIEGTEDTSITYVVDGHYDSVVDLHFPPDIPSIYNAPGADDNGSGTAAILEMARILAVNKPQYNVTFVALDAEEEGGIGGNVFVDSIKDKGINIGLAMNYDMIGSKHDGFGYTNDSIFVSKLYPGSEKYAYLFGKMASFYGRLADTNLVASYNDVYLNGSDSWEFYQNGYNVTYCEEYRFSDDWHMLTDSITHMNIRYCTSIIKAGLGMLATFANYPRMVEDIQAVFLDEEDKIYLQWKGNQASNIVGYRVYYGKASANYDGCVFVNGLGDTINNLADDSYYFTVRAVDELERQSITAQEVNVQKPGVNTILIVDNDYNALDVSGESWTKYVESSIANLGYRFSKVTIEQNYTTLLGYFNKYPLIIWDIGPNYNTLGDTSYKAFSESDNNGLMEYLNGGGKLWIIGQKYLWMGNPDTAAHPNLWTDYLKLSSADGWTNMSCSTIAGVEGDPIGDSYLDSIINYYARLNNNYYTSHNYGCALQPLVADTNVEGFMTNEGGGYVGIRSKADISGGYKFVYTAFPFEAISSGRQRDSLAGRIIRWLIPECSDYMPPAVPVGLKLTMLDSHIVCVWNKNDESDLAGYNVYRALQSGMPKWEKIRTVQQPDTLYIDTTVYMDSIYFYAITAFDSSCPENESSFSSWVMIQATEPSGLEGSDDGVVPKEFKLFQNAPNPFSKSTAISYHLPKTGKVSLNIYNINGQLVKTLVNSDQPAGRYTANWDRRDNQNKQVSAGMYIYRLSAGNQTLSNKMIVLR